MEPKSDNVGIGYHWSDWEFNFNVETNFQMIKSIIKIIDGLERLMYKLGERRLKRIIRREAKAERKKAEALRKEDWQKYWKR